MKIEKDAVTFEMPDADFVAKFGMQAAADMVLVHGTDLRLCLYGKAL